MKEGLEPFKRVKDYGWTLALEITTRCNANCVMCSHQNLRRKNRDLSVPEIMDIVDQGVELGIKRVQTHLFGEPTLHPEFPKICNLIHDKYPQLEQHNYTNGSRLFIPEIRRAMLNTHSVINISIDGATDDTMKKVRPGLNPATVRTGVEALWAERKGGKPRIVTWMVVMDENRHEKKLYHTRWGPFCDKVRQPSVINYADGRRQILKSAIRDHTRPCVRPFRGIIVTINKNLVICCSDWDEREILGNLEQESLRSLWLGERMTEIRQLHIKGECQQIPVCASCPCKMYARRVRKEPLNTN